MSEEISSALPGKCRIAAYRGATLPAALRVDQTTRGIVVVTALGVRYVIEGTVRKTQNRVRITARLVRTGDDVSVWSDSYERELTDVFAIQEDIAMAITEALKVPLDLNRGIQPASASGLDPKSYEQFLRATALMRARFTGVKEAIDILEGVVKRNPHYAPAWAFLAQCYSWMPGFISPYDVAERHRRIQIFFPMAKEAAHRAIGLDPKLAEPYLSLSATMQVERFDQRAAWAAAEDLIAKALCP